MASKPVPASSAPYLLGRALLPLRAFLGFTFCFAGLQKLASPRFFDAADPASIQSQLAGAARRSPVHALISPLAHAAVPLGVLIAFGELAVGVGTLLGLRARLAAAGGLALSLMLFLTVSFHSAPYYTGADIVFAFAWTPLLLAGSGSVLSLDAAIADWADKQVGPGRRASRREVVLGGTVTAAVAAPARRRPRSDRHGQAAPSGHSQAGPASQGPARHGHRPGQRRARRAGRLLHRSGHGRSVHRDPAERRHVRGLRRGMPARRLHGWLRPRAEADCLPVPWLAVQRRHRRGGGRPGDGRAEEAQDHRGAERAAIRHLSRPVSRRREASRTGTTSRTGTGCGSSRCPPRTGTPG